MNMIAALPTSIINVSHALNDLQDVRDVLKAIDALPCRVTHVTASSREVRVGSLFLAYPGSVRDGRQFINEAIARGATALLMESPDANYPLQADWKLPLVTAKNLKSMASVIGAHIYQQPADALWMIGVTGTNGKTSVSQWIAQALDAAGRRSAVLGTIGNGLVGALADSDNTTPDALLLQRLLREYVDSGASSCAMEVSSHGLDQRRVADVKYDVAVFTNLTRDHLDYHGTMEAYGEAKAALFNMRGLQAAVVNVDDVFGREIAGRAERRGADVIRYACNGGAKFANLVATNIAMTTAGLCFDLIWYGVGSAETKRASTEHQRIETDILGAFNVSNLLAVIGSLLVSGVALAMAAQIVQTLKPVRGRMQTVRTNNGANTGGSKPLVVVDYAHTPDALEKVLMTVAAIVPERGRLICVFGCGGDRDRGKRPLMAAIAARYADITIITSDNPRRESAEAIIADIAAGMGNVSHHRITDRHQAIFEALNLADSSDVVVIAGKGHENYQIIGNDKHYFSDTEVAEDALACWQQMPPHMQGAV